MEAHAQKQLCPAESAISPIRAKCNSSYHASIFPSISSVAQEWVEQAALGGRPVELGR